MRLTHCRYHEPSLDSSCALQHDGHVSSILLQENRFSPLPGGHFFLVLSHRRRACLDRVDCCARIFATSACSAFKGMRFPIDVILVCIRWYATYPLSYRHPEEMMELASCARSCGPCVRRRRPSRWCVSRRRWASNCRSTGSSSARAARRCMRFARPWALAGPATWSSSAT